MSKPKHLIFSSARLRFTKILGVGGGGGGDTQQWVRGGVGWHRAHREQRDGGAPLCLRGPTVNYRGRKTGFNQQRFGRGGEYGAPISPVPLPYAPPNPRLPPSPGTPLSPTDAGSPCAVPGGRTPPAPGPALPRCPSPPPPASPAPLRFKGPRAPPPPPTPGGPPPPPLPRQRAIINRGSRPGPGQPQPLRARAPPAAPQQRPPTPPAAPSAISPTPLLHGADKTPPHGPHPMTAGAHVRPLSAFPAPGTPRGGDGHPPPPLPSPPKVRHSAGVRRKPLLSPR